MSSRLGGNSPKSRYDLQVEPETKGDKEQVAGAKARNQGTSLWLAIKEAEKPGDFERTYRDLRSKHPTKAAAIKAFADVLNHEAREKSLPIMVCYRTLENHISRQYPQLSERRQSKPAISGTAKSIEDRKQTLLRDLALVVAYLCDELGLQYENALKCAKERIGMD